ncbi:MAG: dihydroorotate dehydrogenase (quinone), partial [Helicobacteraceae bacterium]|nr:dihydroorotate dehydrogenase (quinone) [Helicobacteraceae bacterium]
MIDCTCLRKVLFKFQPETAHALAEFALRGAEQIPFALGAIASRFAACDPSLEQTVFGLTFHNPCGIAAGFDKNATM